MTLTRNALATLRPQRAIWVDDNGVMQRPDLTEPGNALLRRAARSNADLVAIFGAVFAAVRKRSQAAAKAELVLVRKNRGGETVEITDHPALDALRRVNESLTYKQGFGLIEQHKLTFGPAYWIKRRNRLGVPVEFEIWEPDRVEVVPRADKPWVPAAFKRHKDVGTVETVAPEDVIWFRYMVDPRNPLRSLTPIGAVRMEVDTALEAQRYNQRFFDNDALPAALISVADAGPAEVSRIESDLDRKFRGTDNKHRIMVTEGDLKVIGTPMAHKDMEFLAQHRMTKEDVAMAFEMNPIDLGDSAQATKDNLDGFTTAFWLMILNELENTVEELNEFYIHPDFGEELDLIVRLNVPALQDDKKLQAQIDEINLRSGKVVINELRERDGIEPVTWGDVPLVSQNVKPLGYEPPAPVVAPPMPEDGDEEMDDMPRRLRIPTVRNLEDAEAEARSGWERRLSRELRAIMAHLEEADRRTARALDVSDVDSYSWDWWLRYGKAVMEELAAAYVAALESGGFVETPLLPTHEIAVRYARARAGELLNLSERTNVVALTRQHVKDLVADAIANGDSMRTLKNKLRNDFAFSDSRADMIARTEAATANGKAKLQAYSSNGYEGKRWVTAHDERVDDFPCGANEDAGPIFLHESFPSGDDTVPGHPNCRCTILPVVEMPRRTVTVKTPERDAQGNILRVREEVTRGL